VHQASDSNASRTDHHKTASQWRLGFRDESHDSFRQSLSSVGRIPDEDDAAGLSRVGVDKLAKIFIFCQENVLLAQRQIHDHRVIGAGCQFCNRKHIMTDSTERSDDRKISAFVGKKMHRLAFGPLSGGGRAHEHRFFMRHGVSGIRNSGLDVDLGQTGVCIEKFAFRRTFPEFSKD
jgi:hypothetical protein